MCFDASGCSFTGITSEVGAAGPRAVLLWRILSGCSVWGTSIGWVVASALVADMCEPTLAVAGALIVFPANCFASDRLREVFPTCQG